jgi:hypothetical protein
MKNQTRIKYVAKYTVTQINKNFRGKLWAPRIRKTILKSIWVSSDKEAKDHVKKLKESGGTS